MATMKAYAKKYLNKLVSPAREEYVLTLKNVGTVSADDIIQEASDHAKMEQDDVRKAFNAVCKAAGTFMALGHGVQLPNIGSLQPQLRAKAVLTEAECNTDTIKGTGGVSFTMLPIGNLKKSIANMSVRVVKSGADDSDSATDGEGDPNSGQTGGSGNQNQNTQYTLTLNFHDGSQEELFYAEGATIVYPQNTQDYVWPSDRPRTMPARNVTVTEELDANLDPGV